MKAALFAGLWVVGTWVVVVACLWALSLITHPDLAEAVREITIFVSPLIAMFVSGFASGAHDSKRVFWFAIVGFVVTLALALMTVGLLMMGVSG